MGSTPASLAVGDFTGNGKLDLAVADKDSGTVSILFGNGDGTFQPAVSYPAGPLPDFVAVGDFTGNGHLDLAVANGAPSGPVAPNGTVSILLGNGDGTFQPAVPYPVEGNDPDSIVVADFTGDGKLDLAVGNYFGSVSVLLGNGDGTFRAGHTYSPDKSRSGFELETGSLAVGDFNGDGKLDLASFFYNPFGESTVNILLGDGDGTFQPAGIFPVGNESFGSIAAGDFNGDGHLDLALADVASGTLKVLLGNGDGTFQVPHSYAVGDESFGSIAVGNFNGDGHLDLALAGEDSGTVKVLLGNGDGTFQVSQSYAVGSNPSSVAVGDFTGDGHLDLAVANSGSNTVSILLGNGDGSFRTAATTLTVTSSPNPSVVDQAVMFTAMVTAVAPATGTPTGTVTFRDGTTAIGTVSLNANGSAIFSPRTLLSAGTHIITADYSGDPNFESSLSATLTQTVNTLNQNYVTQLYRDLLGRRPIAVGWCSGPVF